MRIVIIHCLKELINGGQDNQLQSEVRKNKNHKIKETKKNIKK